MNYNFFDKLEGNLLLSHVLGYACPESYQAISLTCKRFNTCTKLQLFWLRAIQQGLITLLARCDVTMVPTIAFEDFNPFFRPKRTHFLPPELPWYAFLEWLFYPDNEILSRVYGTMPEGYAVMLCNTTTNFAVTFNWDLNFARCIIRMAANYDSNLPWGIMTCDTYLRYKRIFYKEQVKFTHSIRTVSYCECIVTKNGKRNIWYGRGRFVDDLCRTDETDPDGYYSEITY